jgi:hypothetical protein
VPNFSRVFSALWVKFPTRRNREFFQGQQGFFRANQELSRAAVLLGGGQDGVDARPEGHSDRGYPRPREEVFRAGWKPAARNASNAAAERRSRNRPSR